MAQFNVGVRSALVHDIAVLCCMKLKESFQSRFASECPYIQLSMEDCPHIKPFGLMLKLEMVCSDENTRTAAYDSFIEVKDFMRNMLMYAFSEENVSVSCFEESTKAEFEIAGKV